MSRQPVTPTSLSLSRCVCLQTHFVRKDQRLLFLYDNKVITVKPGKDRIGQGPKDVAVKGIQVELPVGPVAAAADQPLDDVECVICLATCLPAHEAKAAPCGHRFCLTCIMVWWERVDTCPLCRKPIEQLLACFTDVSRKTPTRRFKKTAAARAAGGVLESMYLQQYDHLPQAWLTSPIIEM